MRGETHSHFSEQFPFEKIVDLKIADTQEWGIQAGQAKLEMHGTQEAREYFGAWDIKV